MKTKLFALILALAMLLGAFSACGKQTGKATSSTDTTGTTAGTAGTTEPSTGTTEPVKQPEENYDGKLVFDHAMELKYAKCFSVDYYKGGYKIAKTADGTTLLIVPEGMSVPKEAPAEAIVLQQPINKLLISSTPVTSLINAVGALDAISLTTYDTTSWYIDDVKNALTSGKLVYIGDYKSPDYEKITAAGTTFAIFSTMLTDDVAAQLKQLKVDVMLDQSVGEDHPLARVEWAKLYGAMFNKEEQAEEVFNKQDAFIENINKLSKLDKTVAIFYITSKGVLYARNADDYMTKMVSLAGGKYALADYGVGKTGTAKMEMEAFYDKAKDADYIIYIWSLGGKPETLADLLGRADILKEMKAVKNGNVWCTTPDFFQISNTIGGMINDVRLMLEADASTDKLTYLFKLK